MKEKQFTPLMWIHLILMEVLAALSIGTAIFLMFSISTNHTAEFTALKTSVIFTIILTIINAIALISGVIYLFKGYQKDATSYYKTFMMLNAVAAIVFAIMTITVMKNTSSLDGTPIASNAMYILGIILMVIKVVLLFALTFGKDLGKKNSWIIFGVILVSDVLVGLLFNTAGDWAPYRFVSALPRLLMDGVIGLSIKGKYDDKDIRGTI